MNLATLPQQFRPDSKVRVTVAQCHADLKAEFLADFLRATPGACLRTPALGDSINPRRRMSTVEEVVQSLIDRPDSIILKNLLLVCKAAATGVECATLAKMLVSLMAEQYAQEHADDAAADEEARLL